MVSLFTIYLLLVEGIRHLLTLLPLQQPSRSQASGGDGYHAGHYGAREETFAEDGWARGDCVWPDAEDAAGVGGE